MPHTEGCDCHVRLAIVSEGLVERLLARAAITERVVVGTELKLRGLRSPAKSTQPLVPDRHLKEVLALCDANRGPAARPGILVARLADETGWIDGDREIAVLRAELDAAR